MVPGLRSSPIYIVDTKPDPRHPTLAKVLEPEELGKRAGYSQPHTSHFGHPWRLPDRWARWHRAARLRVVRVRGRWEVDRGPQYLHYDAWWHLNFDTMISSEWGTPSKIEDGVNPDLLLGKKYGHALHVWDLRRRRHQQVLELPEEYQIVLELRPAKDPTKAYGFVNAVVNVTDLSWSIWMWHLTDGEW